MARRHDPHFGVFTRTIAGEGSGAQAIILRRKPLGGQMP
jgi:hypothetical protein